MASGPSHLQHLLVGINYSKWWFHLFAAWLHGISDDACFVGTKLREQRANLVNMSLSRLLRGAQIVTKYTPNTILFQTLRDPVLFICQHCMHDIGMIVLGTVNGRPHSLQETPQDLKLQLKPTQTLSSWKLYMIIFGSPRGWQKTPVTLMR